MNKEIFKIKQNTKNKEIRIFGIPIFSLQNADDYDYKRKQIKIFGIKITYKNPQWLKEAPKYNLVQNTKNLSYEIKSGKNILFIASYFVEAGGIETRILQYINQLQKQGWNVYLLSENNLSKDLKKYTNFYLNFDADNVQECLEEIIDRYNINCVEFQFKSSKILRKFNIKQLKNKVKLGCCIHNIGVKNINKLNQFDYKIIVSGQMYKYHYKDIVNPVIIKNTINTSEYENVSKWQYKDQKTAILISRINVDKMQSVECFIKYCQKNQIPFEIAGGEQIKKNLKNKLIKKYNLDEKIFIGQVDTVKFLKQNIDKYLFVAGVGQVVLEAGILGYPVYVSSDYNRKNYSFITKENFDLFDNFTIKSHSPVSKNNKKVFSFNKNEIENYYLVDKIKQERNIDICFKQYLNTIRG